MEIDNKSHWEKVYQTKSPDEVSWTQVKPKTSLDYILKNTKSKNDSIIDIGSGDSLLVDFLVDEGFTEITVLDISEHAIERAKARLGKKSKEVTWIVEDITKFKPNRNYDIWHDRAVFHFLTSKEDQTYYSNLVSNHIIKNLVIATFSKEGPLKCSGLEICQYDRNSLNEIFKENFKLTECQNEDHLTPFQTIQKFIFCNFEKI